MARNNFLADAALAAGLSALYLNLPVNLVKFYHVPGVLAAALGGLFLIPVGWYVIVRRERFIVDKWFGLMVVFLMTMIISALFAKDARIALAEIATFALEGLLLYLLIVNGVRTRRTLRLVIWTTLLSAALLGGLNLYQKLAGDYENEFGGLAQRTEIDYHNRTRVTERAQGQVAEQNRFAQTLLVLLPLAAFGTMASTKRGRLAAAITAVFIGCGIVLSYSRGAFLAVMVMAVAAVLLGFLRARTVLIPLAAGALIVVSFTPEYAARVGTIAGLPNLVTVDPGTTTEYVIENRATEMLSALHVAEDHPFFGVGPGQYAPFYSVQYQMDPDVAYRFIRREREAHSLYLGIAAETGVMGLGVFLAIMTWMMIDLYRTGRRVANSDRPGAQVLFALWLGLAGYFVSGLFLHLAYQRYFWLLIALAAASIQIFKSEDQAECSAS